MKTKFILETSTLEDVLMKKYQDMKKQDANTCDICGKNPCQCKKSDEKELAEDHFNHSINDAFKMLDDLMRQERDLDIEPMLKRLSPELQKQLVQWAQTDGKAAVANDEYPEADWAARINKYLHGVAEDAPEGKVRFVVDSERAYQAVMARYGDVIEWDNNEYMVIPAKLWPRVQEVAYDADGIGAEDVDGGSDYENPEHYGVEETSDDGGSDSENRVEEGSFDPQHYFDANKDSKVRRKAEVDQSQHKQDWGRDPLDDITHLAFKAGEKVKGMFKKPSKLEELGANNPPQATGTSPTPTANTAANVAATTSTLNPQEQKQLDDLLKKAGVVK